MGEVYQARDVAAVDVQALLQADIEQLTFKLSPALLWLTSYWPLFDLWQFLTHEQAEPPTDKHPQAIAVFRDADLHVQLVSLPVPGAAFLDCLKAGAALRVARDGLGDDDLQQVMALLVHHELIVTAETAVSLSPDTGLDPPDETLIP